MLEGKNNEKKSVGKAVNTAAAGVCISVTAEFAEEAEP